MRGPLAVAAVVFLLGAGLALAAGSARPRLVIMPGGASASSSLFVADADGSNERPLLAGTSVDYNPTFSADGSWIVFTSERGGSADIYRAHPDGSGLERLTNDPSFEDQGALSPDGRTLAFVSTRGGGLANVWLMDLATRRSRKLTTGRSSNLRPSWSPDGRWIAFMSDRDTPHQRVGPNPDKPGGAVECCGWEIVPFSALYVVRANGQDLRRLTAPEGFSGGPKWSLDGQRIVFASRRPDAYFGNGVRSQIMSIDVASGVPQIHTGDEGQAVSPQHLNAGDIRFLARGPDGAVSLADTTGRKVSVARISNPSWAPDGKTVAYAKPGPSLFPRPSQPGALAPAPLRSAMFDGYQNGLIAETASYSPDGGRVVVCLNQGQSHSLLIMDADGSNVRTLYSTTGAAPFETVSWSPDGKWIAFGIGRTGTRDPIVAGQLALIGSDGSGFRMLTAGPLNSGYPSFSPDSKRLVYRVLGAERGLRVLSLENGEITNLTSEWDNFPAWSSRGLIVFTSYRTGDFEVYTILPDGRNLRRLTNDRGNDSHPHWSPDGNWIVFVSSRAGWKDAEMAPAQVNGDLFMMRANGSDVRQLTDNQWEEMANAWLPARY